METRTPTCTAKGFLMESRTCFVRLTISRSKQRDSRKIQHLFLGEGKQNPWMLGMDRRKKRKRLRAIHVWIPRQKTNCASTLGAAVDRKSTRLNSSHVSISYAVFCLKKKTANDSAH